MLQLLHHKLSRSRNLGLYAGSLSVFATGSQAPAPVVPVCLPLIFCCLLLTGWEMQQQLQSADQKTVHMKYDRGVDLWSIGKSALSLCM